jgi:uncharacterized repeat protein (TIGR01451 family)
MKISKFSKPNFKFGTSLKVVVILAMVVSTSLALAPRKNSEVLADNGGSTSCTNSSTPVFNPYPSSLNPGNCQDYPFMRARVDHADGTQTDFTTGSVQAQPGEKVEVVLYIDNGAALNTTAATGEQLTTNASLESGSSHNISASVSATNVSNTLSGNLGINTPDGSTLQIDAKSGQWFQYQSFMGNLGNIVNNNTQLPDQATCFTYERFIYMIFDVTGSVITPPVVTPPANSSFNLFMNPKNQICVNTKIDFSVQDATADLNGKQIFWSSTLNGQDTGEDLAGYNQFISNGFWGGTSAQPYTQVGNWTKTATVYSGSGFNNPISHTLNFTILPASDPSCGGVTTPPVNSSFDLFMNPKNQICVNTKIDFSVQNATADLNGKQIFWTSTLNGSNTGENLAGYNQFISNGFWGGTSAQPYTQVGNWTKTATVYSGTGFNNPISRTLNFTILPASNQACGGVVTPPPAQLVCQLTGPSTVDNNHQATFSVTGGNSPYTWSANGLGSASPSFNNFAVQYANPGTYTPSVTDNQGNKAFCPPVNVTAVSQNPSTFTATATATASATASASCSNGATATASASASASATATSNVSQQDAQNKAQSQANAQAQAKANAQAQASASVQCPVTPPACVVNSNFALNASAVVKNGSNYSVNLTWSSTGGNQIKITQLNPGSSVENIVTVGNASGSININGLLPASTYIFKMYDSACGQFLTTVQVVTPSNPGQLTCSVQSSTIASGSQANFTAQGGTAPYKWSGDGSPSTGTGSSFNSTYTNTSTSSVNHSVSVASNDGQTVNCSVVVNPAPQQTPPTNSGNCNNDSNSCNNNTNTNNSTNNNSTNSSNQNNNSNINGNNNVVSQTNNNCVNNSCNTTNNTVYINSNGSVVPANQFSQLSITKNVRNLFSGSFTNSTTANNGDTVEFQIIITNTGSATANNVRLTDNLPAGLNLISNGVLVNGSQVTNGNLYNGMYLGSLNAGQSETITFQARVNSNGSSSIQNTATASSDNAGSVQASAWVFVNGSNFVQGSSINLSYSKSAFNNSKNQDASAIAASTGDLITYTLTVSNSGNQPANNFVVTDDLSQVLPYADIVDNGGGNINGNVISYPGITVPANGSVTRSFQVRIKSSLSSSLSYVMTNTYGNTVTIRINVPQVLGAFTAPKTGADTNAFVFAGMLTAGFAVYKKKNIILKLIFS